MPYRKKKTELIKLKKGELPSKKIIREYFKLRKIGLPKEIADELSRVRMRTIKKKLKGGK